MLNPNKHKKTITKTRHKHKHEQFVPCLPRSNLKDGKEAVLAKANTANKREARHG